MDHGWCGLVYGLSRCAGRELLEVPGLGRLQFYSICGTPTRNHVSMARRCSEPRLSDEIDVMCDIHYNDSLSDDRSHTDFAGEWRCHRAGNVHMVSGSWRCRLQAVRQQQTDHDDDLQDIRPCFGRQRSGIVVCHCGVCPTMRRAPVGDRHVQYLRHIGYNNSVSGRRVGLRRRVRSDLRSDYGRLALRS